MAGASCCSFRIRRTATGFPPLLEPLAWHWGAESARLVASGHALPLLGGRFACSLFAAVTVEEGEFGWRTPLTAREVAADPAFASALARLMAARPAPFDRPRIMAILNVTPDSFSDGGRFAPLPAAIAAARAFIEEGADIVDVGGESTRPGSQPVAIEEELERVLPVVEALSRDGIFVSVDTRKAAVARAALAAGARMINDVSGLQYDPALAEVVAEAGAFLVLGHSRGEPATMNLAPTYRDCPLECFLELERSLARARSAGIAAHHLLADPGLGFAKKEPHNLAILRHLGLFHGLGVPLVLGASRKGLTARLERGYPPTARLPASLAAALLALERGFAVLRVHDVTATRQLVDLFAALDSCAAS
ncbi:Dihydropteroate synthase [bacterium HR40]|nr:Dihydropteroate synthase [bacterium HR40]